MKLRELRNELRQDPEYAAAERELKPLLDLADEILELRLERGWSQADLARHVGTRQANISRIENGLGNPTYKFLQKLAEAFDTELSIHIKPQDPVEHTTVVYVSVVSRNQVIASQGTTRRLGSPWYEPESKPRRKVKLSVAA
jgi:transcriptional regulator with XRE-family HTH domain